MTKKQNEKKTPSNQKYVSFKFLWLLQTPIVKRKFLTKENFHFIKNHKSYAFVKFLARNIFSTSSQFSVSRPSEAGVVELFLGEAYVNVEVHGSCALPCLPKKAQILARALIERGPGQILAN